MRLHRLELSAFGPFAGRQSVDFGRLSAAGLFLLHGPTGAGKTSVLDGVCYALYGQVPGARPATRLRSDHAAPGTPTEVVLELTVAERHLEITRRPEQPRAKKRGTGTTMDRAVTLLREHDGEQWRGLSISHQEAGEEIRRLLGMSCEQFCQVVLLPQGEFATFLRAGAAERTALLGRLFDTRRFKAVESRLRDMKARAARDLADGDAALDRLAARMRQAAGTRSAAASAAGAATGSGAGAGANASAEPGAAAEGAAQDAPGPGDDALGGPAAGAGDTAGLLAWAAVLRCEARERHTGTRLAVAAAETAHTAAAEALARARDLHALQRRHAEARARAAALEAERPARTAARAALTRARAAATVAPALALRDEAAARHAEAARQEAAALAALAVAEPAAATAAAGGAGGAAGGGGPAPEPRPGTPEPPASEVPVAGPAGQRSGMPSPGRATADEDAPAPPPALSGGGPAASPAEGSSPGPSAVPVPGRAAPSAGAAGSELALPPVAAPPAPRSGGPLPGPSAVPGPESPESVAPGSRVPRQQPRPPQAPGCSVPTPARPGGRADPQAVHGAGRAAGTSPSAEDLALRAGAVRQELGSLAAAGQDEDRIQEIGKRRAALEREEAADAEAVREAQDWLDRWPGVRAALQERMDTAAEAAARAARLAAERDAARARLDAAAERDRLALDSRVAADRARDARDRTASAREDWQDLREARFAGVAAELAGELVEGHPCRVCGSTEHPAPARASGRPVGREDEDAAYARYQEAADAHEGAGREAARLAAELEAARALAGDRPVTGLAAAHECLAREHRAAVDLAAAVPEARAALDSAERERDRRAAHRQEAHGRAAARASRREELDEQHQRLAAQLTRARGGFASVAERRSHLAEQVGRLDRAVQAVRARTGTAARLADAEAAVARSAAEAGFASPADAAAALLPAPRLREAELREETWAKEEAALDAELTAPEPAAAAALVPADPEAARAVLDAANRRLRDASSAESAAAERCRELDRLGAEATALARRLGPSRDAYARVRHLADLAAATTAENRYRMELETYVLAARLEQVAAAAGVRLQRMSAGRYTLVHSDARTGGRGKSGLGLMVVDAWTGTERDTATLSGGETFFASLALALGLADVVTDESGGTRLDTLFIDEGFGSLDDQTLDEVLDVLDGLRERDRAVGIVSHVADLRHRIPVQLRVLKERDGSTIRLRTGGAAPE